MSGQAQSSATLLGLHLASFHIFGAWVSFTAWPGAWGSHLALPGRREDSQMPCTFPSAALTQMVIHAVLHSSSVPTHCVTSQAPLWSQLAA